MKPRKLRKLYENYFIQIIIRLGCSSDNKSFIRSLALLHKIKNLNYMKIVNDLYFKRVFSQTCLICEFYTNKTFSSVDKKTTHHL